MTLSLSVSPARSLCLGTLAGEEPRPSGLPSGWTLRPAAAELGVHWTHLGKVLAGKRHSQSLTRRAAALPTIQSTTTNPTLNPPCQRNQPSPPLR